MARKALWHAGQVLRQGRRFPGGHLKDFYAVAVHHAALCLWAFGIVTRASGARGGGVGLYAQQQQQHYRLHQQQQERQRLPGQGQRQFGYQGAPTVLLDGAESPAVHAWIGSGQGRPAIRRLDTGGGEEGGNTATQPTECLLEDPRACMEVAQEVLRANFVGTWESLPPLSENIIAVLKRLEEAARAVGMG